MEFGSLEGRKYPAVVDWIRVKQSKKLPITPSDVLSSKDIEALVDHCYNPRDRALIMTMYESAGRAGEILAMKKSDVLFDQY